MLSVYIEQANARFSSFAGTDAEEARRLYAAHKLTLYARTALPDGMMPVKALIAEAGQSRRQIAGKKVGEVSVTYAAGASQCSSVSADRADLAETDFGRQLLSLMRKYSRSAYIP